MHRPLLRTLVAALLCAAPALRAQDTPQQPPFGESVTVREALLDVLVTDRDGNVIVGLGKDDFVLEEDGKTKPVASVAFYSNRRFLGTPAEAARGKVEEEAPLAERYLVFLIEDQREANVDSPGVLARQLDASRRLAAWVRMEMLSTDWAAVLSYDRRLVLHQDFTHDRAALTRAIESAATGREPESRFPSRRVTAPGGPSLLANLPAGDELEKKTPRIYEGVSVLAKALQPLRGRKNLIFFTRGAGKIDSFGMYKPDRANYEPMMRALNDANVSVYPIDLIPTGVEHSLADSMSRIASDTGGQYYYAFTTFTQPLRQIAQDTSGYYLLSFEPAATAPGASHKLTVKTKSPEFLVRTRAGYGTSS
jgi:VWFA-related protein